MIYKFFIYSRSETQNGFFERCTSCCYNCWGLFYPCTGKHVYPRNRHKGLCAHHWVHALIEWYIHNPDRGVRFYPQIKLYTCHELLPDHLTKTGSACWHQLSASHAADQRAERSDILNSWTKCTALILHYVPNKPWEKYQPYNDHVRNCIRAAQHTRSNKPSRKRKLPQCELRVSHTMMLAGSQQTSTRNVTLQPFDNLSLKPVHNPPAGMRTKCKDHHHRTN